MDTDFAYSFELIELQACKYFFVTPVKCHTVINCLILKAFHLLLSELVKTSMEYSIRADFISRPRSYLFSHSTSIQCWNYLGNTNRF